MATLGEGNDRAVLVYLLNYFTCISHPDPKGDHSVMFSSPQWERLK